MLFFLSGIFSHFFLSVSVVVANIVVFQLKSHVSHCFLLSLFSDCRALARIARSVIHSSRWACVCMCVFFFLLLLLLLNEFDGQRAVVQAVEQIVCAAACREWEKGEVYSQLNKRNTYRIHRHNIWQNLLHAQYYTVVNEELEMEFNVAIRCNWKFVQNSSWQILSFHSLRCVLFYSDSSVVSFHRRVRSVWVFFPLALTGFLLAWK